MHSFLRFLLQLRKIEEWRLPPGPAMILNKENVSWACLLSLIWQHFEKYTWSPACPSSTALRADFSTRIAVGLFLNISLHHFIVSASNLSNYERKQRITLANSKYIFVAKVHFWANWWASCTTNSCKTRNCMKLKLDYKLIHILTGTTVFTSPIFSASEAV